MDEAVTQIDAVAPKNMQVDGDRSPTEIADDESIGDDPFDVPGDDGGGAKVKLEKRKREKKPRRREGEHARAVPVEDDIEIPTKRPSNSDDRPVSSRELRHLLMGHVNEMKSAWTNFQGQLEGRIEKVENEQRLAGVKFDDLQARTTVVEREVSHQRQINIETKANLESLTSEVEKMKVRPETRPVAPVAAPSGSGVRPEAPAPPDPWADFLRRRGQAPQEINKPPIQSEAEKGDYLSEEEKRTLVVGGWLQDTRRSTIEEESGVILAIPEVKDLIDIEKLQVFGPRRSVGMMKFNSRENESEKELRERMWKVVRIISGLKHVLPSSRESGESKTMWASFVKSRNARIRSAHVSMVRRVTIALAKDALAQQAGSAVQGLNLQMSAYDCDWNMGTVWCGTQKLASSSHRSPRDEEVVVMSQPHRCGENSIVIVLDFGGQKVDTLDIVCKDLDIILAQEVSRGEEGWSEFDKDEFHWVSHRAQGQWRGVAVGIAIDKFDSTIWKGKTSRGIWVVSCVKGIGRVVPRSLHCHTGVTTDVYQAAATEFAATCPRKYRHLPLVCGVDANEVPQWNSEEDGRLAVGQCSANLNVLLHDCLQQGITAVPPEPVFKNAWTHFPRDENRSGRQIDVLLQRQMHLKDVVVHADRRFAIGTDHALLVSELWMSGGPAKTRWGHDSRARWVHRDLPPKQIVDEQDLIDLSKECTRPRVSAAFRDDLETITAIGAARESGLTADWKRVQKMRREKRKNWQQERLSAVLQGDWDSYRQIQGDKKRRRGWWWGDLLQDRSAAQLATEIEDHLHSKLVCGSPHAAPWDERLQELLPQCPSGGDFVPFQQHEVVTELQAMKCRSAVGPDSLGVHFLRAVAVHPDIGGDFLSLINHIVATHELPESWSRSFLALIAKVPSPKKPSDLRPIQALGLHVVARDDNQLILWEVWGEFETFVENGKGKVAQFLIDKLKDKGHETCVQVSLQPDVGIKQGAPESQELFAMILDSVLSDLVAHQQWGDMGSAFDELDLDMLLYQDDIFLLDCDLARLCRRIRIIDRCLARVGLQLSTDKTKIVANDFYRGVRKVKIGEDVFEIAKKGETLKVLGLDFSLSNDQSEQAREITARVRSAAAFHSDILQAPGPWQGKVSIMRTLLESQFNWIGGALHCGQAELQAFNTLQLQTCRDWKLTRTAPSFTLSMSPSSTMGSSRGPVDQCVVPLLLMMVCLFLGGMDGEDSPDGAIPEVTSRHPPWTYEEIAERSAAVWEDGSWNSPWSAPTWNSSLAENVVGGEMTATAEVHGMISSFPPMASSSSSSASAPAHERKKFSERLPLWSSRAHSHQSRKKYLLHLVYLVLSRRWNHLHDKMLIQAKPRVETPVAALTWTWMKKHGIVFVIVDLFVDNLLRKLYTFLCFLMDVTQPASQLPRQKGQHRAWRPVKSTGARRLARNHTAWHDDQDPVISFYDRNKWSDGDVGTDGEDRPDDQLNWTNSVQTDSLAGSEALPSHLTDPDPWSGHWGNYDTWSSNTWSNTWWEDSSWAPSSSSWWPSTNGCWVTSTTSSTSAPIEAGDFPPNFGLFPEVRPARPEEPPIPWRLQLTGAERRLLQEGNVPELPIERIDAILESLEDHEAAESGPESRWALARLIGQAEGALDSLQTIVDILQRRLHPRGYLPITRTPRTVAERVRLYNWMRDSAGFFADTLEFHLRALRPAEERPHPNEVDEDSLHSAPGAPSHASSSSSGEGDNGDHVSEADDHIPDTGTVPRMAPRFLAAFWDEFISDVYGDYFDFVLFGLHLVYFLSVVSELIMVYAIFGFFLVYLPFVVSELFVVYDITRVHTSHLVCGSVGGWSACVVNLYHNDDLSAALEEVALWMPVPPAAPALNGPTMDSSIWSNVARQAAQGDGDGNASQSPLQHPVTALLLQPGLPPSMPEVERNLPSLSRGTLAGLRRRAWQEHVCRRMNNVKFLLEYLRGLSLVAKMFILDVAFARPLRFRSSRVQDIQLKVKPPLLTLFVKVLEMM
ncbi:unnamed protein product [Symbiodinium microadriaticum]|nr:unnamed protein product [Symbiodinium sp. KB8]CAE7694912.1 unnamed protein product [Symbiodinium microadriaticum]